MLYEPVMLGVEYVVDGSQADILVDAAVTGNEMRIEQFVVIFPVSPLPGIVPRPI